MMIQLLDKSVSDKIAAGEVIERPVSIIKELVENSVDAGARNIVVEIKKGGREYIRVTDDGSGIRKEDVERAFLRHATSKIREAVDLEALHTLGFRGEALASIAAVTHLEMVTKTETEKVGTRINISGGEIVSQKPIGCPVGTTIIIRDLFFNTPARLKFLSSDNSETARISTLMSNFAVGFPYLAIKYVSNGKTVFNTLGSGDGMTAIRNVYGGEDFANLITIKGEMNGTKLVGYISKPSVNRSNRKHQIYFVNNRVIESDLIDKAVALGYKERLFEGRFPIAFVMLNVDPATIDVNIHPNKKLVRFDDDEPIKALVSSAIAQGLSTESALAEATPKYVELGIDYNKIDEASEKEKGNYHIHEEIYKPSTETVQEDFKSYLSSLREVRDKTAVAKSSLDDEYKDKDESKAFDLAPMPVAFDISSLRPTGSIFATYITAVDEDNFYLIDQHAAHERVFYEQLVTEYLEGSTYTQLINVPIVIQLTHEEMDLQEKWKTLLTRLGFAIEEFGLNTIAIREIPAYMDMTEAENFAKSFISEVNERLDYNNQVAIDKIITRSCKSAIKAHDLMTLEELNGLFESLKQCRNPYSCPHGRPTIVRFTQYQIERMFKRV